ncbi:unnamed protein product [Aureobasidium mustum]|uniref:Uncharacterized protein n=1 Tax=Aureobasidium mustum TaxID=2773714 RepID=A0A9N8JHT8_9PEZI|nr:unnamed protein product [Aureobasidium mustum]
MPHPSPSSTYPPASTTTAPSQQPSSPSKPTPVPDELCVQNSERQDSLSPREQRSEHDSLTTTSDSASRSAGVTTSLHRPGPSPAVAAAAASQRQPSQHLRLTSLGRIAPARESLESPKSPTRPSSRLSQNSLSSLDYHPRRPGLDDKRISLNTFLSATAPPWSVEETSAKQKCIKLRLVCCVRPTMTVLSQE